jgi:mono/diheme cytochrome c family protein
MNEVNMRNFTIKPLLLTSTALMMALGLPACGGGDSDDKQRPVTTLVRPAGVTGGALGKLVYANYCVQCHAVGSKSAVNTLGAIASVGAMQNLAGHISAQDVADMTLYLANPTGF